VSYRDPYRNVVHYAIINDQGQCELVDWRTQLKWDRRQSGKTLHTQRVGRQRIWISFVGRSEIREGDPPTFWHVGLEPGPRYWPKPRRPLECIKQDVGRLNAEPPDPVHAKTFDDALESLRQGCSVAFRVAYPSMESAQAACQDFIAAASAGIKQRVLKHRGGDEKTQQLLAKLGDWCTSGHGHQSKVAKLLGVKPQKVNDWLGGRRKISAEHALRLAELLRAAARY
jgi:YdaS antitoxin of YdaST toxin-antitoxin system